jgi:glycosylphosphatidylinositol transamidase
MILIQYGACLFTTIITIVIAIMWISDSPEHDGTILKSFCLAQSALVIATVSLLNFTLGVATAILILVPYSLVRPSTNLVVKLVQTILLVCLSPAGLLAAFSCVTDSKLTDVISIILSDYHIVRSWFLTYVCMVYWPINMAMIVLVFTKVSS